MNPNPLKTKVLSDDVFYNKIFYGHREKCEVISTPLITSDNLHFSSLTRVFIVPQDTLGGGFDATQAYVGELANLNIWNRKLSIAEIYNLATCNSKAPAGNVFSWTENNIEIFGGATKWTFEPCRSLN